MKTFLNQYLFALLLSIVPFETFAYDFEAVNDDGITLYYNILSSEEKTVEVTKKSDYDNPYKNYTKVTVPSTVKSKGVEYTVTALGEYGFSSCEKLKEISLPNTITVLKKQSLSYNTSLEIVNLPESLLEIQKETFYLDWSILRLDIPDSVTKIGDSAFAYCENLKSFTLGKGVTTFGTYLFDKAYIEKFFAKVQENVTLTYSTIPAKIMYKSPNVEFYCYNGTRRWRMEFDKVVDSEYVSGIFESDGVYYMPLSPSERTCAAVDVSYLQKDSEITIGSKVSNRGIEMEVKWLGDWFTSGNPNIESITVTGEFDIPSKFASNCNKLKHVDLNVDGIISSESFNNSFTDVTDGEVKISNATSIGEKSFQECKGLKKVELSDNIKGISSYAFSRCENLEQINLPIGLKRIEDYCFDGCSKLPEIILPEQLNYIGKHAFNGCYCLEKADIPPCVEIIDEYAFNATKIKELVIPATVKKLAWHSYYQCKSLERIIFEDGEDFLELDYDKEGMFFYSPMKYLYLGRNISEGNYYHPSPFLQGNIAGYTLEEVVISDIPNKIFKYEFDLCTALKDVKIGNGVTVIEEKGFNGCDNIERISFGSSVKEIGNEAFGKGANIKRIIAKAATPPTCGGTTLSNIDKWSCTLFVPQNSSDAYRSADYWKDFFFIEELDENGNIAANSIELNKTQLTLKLEETAQLTANVLPEEATDKTVLWESSDESIASVSSEGLVTAKSVGNATITARCGKASATCNVTVKPIASESITLNLTSLTLLIEEEETLIATVLPETTTDKTVTWSSSNPSVATVDENGTVYAIAAGTATIKAKNGTNTASCKVTVEKHSQEIVWTQDLAEVAVDDEIELTAEATSGLDITYTITKGKDLASLSGNVLTILREGDIVVRASQSGNDYYKAAESVTKSVRAIDTGIESLVKDGDEVTITNINGIRIHNGSQPNLKSLANGIYIIRNSSGKRFKVWVK